MGCPPELWVLVATRAMQSLGKIWWESTHVAFFETKTIELIPWDEFRDVFYAQYFFETNRAKKKMNFLSLRQHEDMSVAE